MAQGRTPVPLWTRLCFLGFLFTLLLPWDMKLSFLKIGEWEKKKGVLSPGSNGDSQLTMELWRDESYKWKAVFFFLAKKDSYAFMNPTVSIRSLFPRIKGQPAGHCWNKSIVSKVCSGQFPFPWINFGVPWKKQPSKKYICSLIHLIKPTSEVQVCDMQAQDTPNSVTGKDNAFCILLAEWEHNTYLWIDSLIQDTT